MSNYRYGEKHKYPAYITAKRNNANTPRRKLDKVEEDPEMESMKSSDEEEPSFYNVCIADPSVDRSKRHIESENDEDEKKEEVEEDLFLPIVPGPTNSREYVNNKPKIHHQQRIIENDNYSPSSPSPQQGHSRRTRDVKHNRIYKEETGYVGHSSSPSTKSPRRYNDVKHNNIINNKYNEEKKCGDGYELPSSQSHQPHYLNKNHNNNNRYKEEVKEVEESKYSLPSKLEENVEPSPIKKRITVKDSEYITNQRMKDKTQYYLPDNEDTIPNPTKKRSGKKILTKDNGKTMYYLPGEDEENDIEDDDHNHSSNNKKKYTGKKVILGNTESETQYYLPDSGDEDDDDNNKSKKRIPPNGRPKNKRKSIELDESDNPNCYENYDRIKKVPLIIDSPKPPPPLIITNIDNNRRNSNSDNSNPHCRHYHKRNSQNTEYRISKHNIESFPPIDSPSISVEVDDDNDDNNNDDEFTYTANDFSLVKIKHKHKRSQSYPTLLDVMNNQDNNSYKGNNNFNNNNNNNIDYGDLYKVKPFFRKPSFSFPNPNTKPTSKGSKSSKNKIVPFSLIRPNEARVDVMSPNTIVRHNRSRTVSSKRNSTNSNNKTITPVDIDTGNKKKKQNSFHDDQFNFHPDDSDNDEKLSKCLMCVLM